MPSYILKEYTRIIRINKLFLVLITHNVMAITLQSLVIGRVT